MSTEQLTLHAPAKTPLWRNLSFMLMWSSVAASGFGDRLIQLVAKPMLGVNNADASAASIAAAISFFFFLPYVIFNLVGGWLADRLPRKWIMLICDELRAVVLLIAWLWMGRMLQSPEPSIEITAANHWRIYTIIALTGVFAATFVPARFATVPQIVPGRQLQPANAVLTAISVISSLIGIGVGTAIITTGEGSGQVEKIEAARVAVLVGALCFGISGFFFAFLKPVQGKPSGVSLKKKESPLAEFLDAFKYLKTHGKIRMLVILYIVFWGCSFVVVAGVAGLVKTKYGLDLENYLENETKMNLAFGIGMMSSSAVMMMINNRRDMDILSMLMLLTTGVAIGLLSIVPWFYGGVALCYVIGLTGGCFLIMVDTLTQSLTPNNVRGRVFGVRGWVDTFAVVAINFMIWRLPAGTADKIIVPAMGVMGLMLIIMGAIGAGRLFKKGPLPTNANILWHIIRIYMLIFHKLRWYNRERVPLKGKVILAANHTTGIDTFVIQAGMPRLVRWVMNSHYRYKLFNFVWNAINPITVDLDGNDLGAIRTMIRALKEDDGVVGIFPEGRLQRDHRELHEFAPGVGLLARKTKAQIFPVWIAGTPRAKSMFWHFLIPSKSRCFYGEPYTPDASMSNEEIAEDLRQRMMKLGEHAERVMAVEQGKQVPA